MDPYIWVLFIFLLMLPASIAHLSSGPHTEFVNVSSSGFSPDFLTVEKGSIVVWAVEDDGSYWPASNFHPTHEAYPSGNGCIGSSLDACHGLKEGDSYNFTFDQAGRWGIHDHMHPAQTMLIEVGDELPEMVQEKSILESGLPFSGDKNQAIYSVPSISAKDQANISASWCKKYSEKYKIVETAECYARQMENLSFNYGPDFAYEVLFELQKIDRSTKTCHFIVHGIGWGKYKRSPENWQKLIEESRNECTYGEQMGVIEYYTQNLPKGKLTVEFVSELCGENPRANCNHAVGHMMLLESENNISDAINLCYGIKDDGQRYHCLTGMFMERIAATNLVSHGLAPEDWTYSTMWKRINESEALCRSYEGQESVACWREMAHPIAQYYKSDPEKTFDHCNTAPGNSAAWACKTHALHDLASPKRFNLTILEPMCRLERDSGPKFESHCYSALVNIKINSLGAKGSQDVINFCASLPDEFKQTCFKSIIRSLKGIKTSIGDLREFCKNIPENYKKQCIGSFNASGSQSAALDRETGYDNPAKFGIINIFRYPYDYLSGFINELGKMAN